MKKQDIKIGDIFIKLQGTEYGYNVIWIYKITGYSFGDGVYTTINRISNDRGEIRNVEQKASYWERNNIINEIKNKIIFPVIKNSLQESIIKYIEDGLEKD